MGTFYRAKDLARHQRLKAERLAHTLRVFHSNLAQDCYHEAKIITGGTTSTRDLNAMGNPYGRRGGSYSDIKSRKTMLSRQRTVKGSRVKLPPLPINKQTGKLSQAIKLSKHTGGNAVQSYVLQVYRNIAPYAKYVLSLGGTVKMVARPFWQYLFKFWKRKNFELLIKMREEVKK